ncbi:Gfo/Idh/MocA family protein [Paenibacillus puldeungensis]|uniref:Gfo/Idh/MocA family protein n=1 Tax=Paenibacillus puldeungensis TaxID=696536 RepID=A0ABW3RRM4_9BACL
MSIPPLKIGIIGLDTSHVTEFTAILNDPQHPHHIEGGTIQVAYPGVPSSDFELSYGRIQGFTDELVRDYQVRLAHSEEEVAEECDAILLESVDARVHLEQFKRIAPYGKPVFVDKPLALSTREATEMFELAEKYRVPFMSCSSLRFGEALSEQLQEMKQGESIIGADCYGPMAIEPTQPGLFWYGVHMVEMLYRVLGKGCVSVRTFTNDDFDFVIGTWADGRIGTVRGNRKGNYKFGALVHGDKSTRYANLSDHPKPFYVSMLEKVMHLFQTGEAAIDHEETWEIIRFMECANMSRETGTAVRL